MCRRRRASRTGSPRALIFDTHYDTYKGVIAYVRVIDGTIDLNTKHQIDGDRRRS